MEVACALLAEGNTTIKKRQRRSRKRTKEYQKKRRKKLKQLIRDAKDKPCMDCGIQKAVDEMTFDHVRGTKRFNLSAAPTSKNQILNELAKCDVVCRDCHDKREISRGVMNDKERVAEDGS